MRLLFIRHGDPDYENDTLTEKGHREASLLAKTAKDLTLGTCFLSPLGRAQDTARYCLEAAGLTGQTMDWLRELPPNLNLDQAPEFQNAYTNIKIIDGIRQNCSFWDMLPDFWTEDPCYMDPVRWRESPITKKCNLLQIYDDACRNLDALLEEHGYVREGRHYRVVRESTETLSFFCHFAISCALISHLWAVSPFTLWFHTQLAPSSVTELVTEERTPGYAHFRSQRIGDISHLFMGGEEPSFSGRFCEVYSNKEQRH